MMPVPNTATPPAIIRHAQARRVAIARRWIERALSMLEELEKPEHVDDESGGYRTFCRTCGEDFAISLKEREWLASKGLALFKHCEPCRAHRRQQALEAR